MRPAPARHLRSVHVIDADETHAVVETPEHEEIEFDGCSEEELQAKLHDFCAWAS